MVVVLVMLLVPSISLLQAVAALGHFTVELHGIAVLEVRVVIVYFLVLTHACNDRDGCFESELRLSLQILVQLR